MTDTRALGKRLDRLEVHLRHIETVTDEPRFCMKWSQDGIDQVALRIQLMQWLNPGEVERCICFFASVEGKLCQCDTFDAFLEVLSTEELMSLKKWLLLIKGRKTGQEDLEGEE